MTYLRWQDFPAWSTCAGRPALEESEGEVPDDIPRLCAAEKAALEERRTALAAQGASVDLLPLQVLDVGNITGERGALAWGSVLLIEFKDHAALEVYPADKILGLAALVKYSILHAFSNTNVGTPDELYRYGMAVTEAASLSMNLRQSVTALEHLVPGEHCVGCRAAYRCPALTKDIHEEVFGVLESPEDLDAKPQAKLPADAEEWARVKLPIIENWVAQVKERLYGKEKPAPIKRHRRKKSKKARQPARDNHNP